MNDKSNLQYLIIFLLVISCADQNIGLKEESFLHSLTAVAGPQKQKKITPVDKKSKAYVSGEILVKFKDGTDDHVIKAIQAKLHLKTIRLVYKPNLYLMKIIDGTSVESVILSLQQYKEVKYSEPNYKRIIQ